MIQMIFFSGQVAGLDSRLTGTEGKSTSLLQKFSQYFCNILKDLYYKIVKYYRLISCRIKLLELVVKKLRQINL